MTKQFTAAVAAALTVLSASAGLAQTAAKPTMHKPMKHSAMKPMGHSMMAAKTVYVCKDCKEYWPAAEAKKMGYKDSMGHKLTKMSKAPAGFLDGTTATM